MLSVAVRPLGRTCLAGDLVITAPLTALLAVVDAWRPRARSGMRTPLLVLSVLTTVLAVWAERAGSALLRPLTVAAKAANQELPVITLAHVHQADRLSVTSFVLSVAVLSLVATAAARPARSTVPGPRSAATASRWWWPPADARNRRSGGAAAGGRDAGTGGRRRARHSSGCWQLREGR